MDEVTQEDIIIAPQTFDQKSFGNVNIAIYSSMGVKLVDYNTVTYEDSPLWFYLEKFPGGVYSIIITNLDTKIRNICRFVVVRGK